MLFLKSNVKSVTNHLNICYSLIHKFKKNRILHEIICDLESKICLIGLFKGRLAKILLIVQNAIMIYTRF